MKYHLIVGFGKWSKKNLDYLRNKKKLKNIVIKTRDKFIYPNLLYLGRNKGWSFLFFSGGGECKS